MYIHIQPEVKSIFGICFPPVLLHAFILKAALELKAILSTVDMSILIPVARAWIAMKTLCFFGPGGDFCFLCWSFYGEIETTLQTNMAMENPHFQ